MSEVHIRVVVEELDQSLTSVSSGSNQTNAGGDIVRGILLAKRRVGVCGGSIASLLLASNDRHGSMDDWACRPGRREGSGIVETDDAAVRVRRSGD